MRLESSCRLHVARALLDVCYAIIAVLFLKLSADARALPAYQLVVELLLALRR